MKEIAIEVFGGLKQFFPKQFTIEQQLGSTIGDVISHLKETNPKAQLLLAQSVVAIGNEVFNSETIIDNVATLVIMPPFSGG